MERKKAQFLLHFLNCLEGITKTAEFCVFDEKRVLSKIKAKIEPQKLIKKIT